MQRTDRILLDSNVVIEAVRIRKWAALANALRLETVQKCAEELSSGRPWELGYVSVTDDDIRGFAAIHAVPLLTLARFELEAAQASTLDAGERHLLAFAAGLTDQAWVLSSPDRAAIRVATKVGLGDRLVSLEQILAVVGESSSEVRPHHRTDWLSSARTDALLF